MLAENGVSGCTAFRTTEFSIEDDDGRCMTLARQKA